MFPRFARSHSERSWENAVPRTAVPFIPSHASLCSGGHSWHRPSSDREPLRVNTNRIPRPGLDSNRKIANHNDRFRLHEPPDCSKLRIWRRLAEAGASSPPFPAHLKRLPPARPASKQTGPVPIAYRPRIVWPVSTMPPCAADSAPIPQPPGPAWSGRCRRCRAGRNRPVSGCPGRPRRGGASAPGPR